MAATQLAQPSAGSAIDIVRPSLSISHERARTSEAETIPPALDPATR